MQRVIHVILPLVAHHPLKLTTQVQMLLAGVFQKIFSEVKWQHYPPTCACDHLMSYSVEHMQSENNRNQFR